ncbi:hypothetical protein AB9P05_12110 [Roseivirga sp. BDSF3-8]|uniref:PDC sensor domain-containing protein n=1 Tax=Roseivirga sp. BDSF3-8 TaxID=3241598 RepID=UPI0035320FA1
MTRQTKISLITSLSLVAGLLYYFFVYAQNREVFLHRQNYRILSQISSNLEQKFISLKKSASRQGKDNLSAVFELIDKTELEPCGNSDCATFLVEKSKDSLFVHYTQGRPGLLFYSESLKDSMLVRLPIETLLQGLLRQKFDEYVLFRNEKAIYSTLPSAYNSTFLHDTVAHGVSEIAIGGFNYLHYEQPLRMGDNAEWTLTGLRDKSAFNTEKFRVSPFLLAVLAILFLVFTMGMPFIKLALLSRKEQLDTRDILFVTAGLILGSMLLTLLSLDFHSYSFPERAKTENNLKNLNEKVRTNFTAELDSMYRQLQAIDKNKGRDGEWNMPGWLGVTATDVIYPYFFQVIWMNAEGNQKGMPKYSTSRTITPKIDVSDRGYFRYLKDPEKYWKLPGMEGEGFVLEQIISWNTGEYLTVMGIKSKSSIGAYSSAITTQMVSVSDPVVAPGYSFAIIDSEGKVLYHSDSEKSYHENLITESQNNDHLVSALQARHDNTFTMTYMGRLHRAYIHPVEGTPLSLVTMADSDYFRTSNTLILTSVGLMALLLFSLYGYQFVVKRVISYRKSMMEYQTTQFGWLRPNEQLVREYGMLTVAHVLHLVLLTIVHFLYIRSGHGQVVLPLFLIAPAIAVFFSFRQLGVFTGRSTAREVKGMNVAVLSTILLVFLLSIAIMNLRAFLLLLYILPASLLYYLALPSQANRHRPIGRLSVWVNRFFKIKSRNRYYAFLLSLITIVSIAPVLSIYEVTYDRELLISKSYDLVQMGRHLDRHLAEFESMTEQRPGLRAYENGFLTLSTYGDFKGVNYRKIPPAKIDVTSPDLNENEDIYEVITHIRPFFNTLARANNEMIWRASADSSWYKFFTSDIDKLEKRNDASFRSLRQLADKMGKQSDEFKDTLIVVYKGHRPSDYAFLLGSGIKPFNLASSSGNNESFALYRNGLARFFLMFFLPSIIGFILLYSIIRFCIQKIFLYQRLQSPALFCTTDRLIHLLEQHDIFLVGLPRSGRSHMINQFRKDSKHQCLYVDFRTWSDTETDAVELINGKKVIILDHLEHDWNEKEFNDAKMKFICRIISNKQDDQHIIISSALVPRHLGLFDVEDSPELHRFMLLLNRFVKLFYPLKDTKEGCPCIEIAENHKYWKRICYTIKHETALGYYMKGLRDPLMNYFRGLLTTGRGAHLEEEVLLKIQSLAHLYYKSLWQFLTTEEKVVVIDMARDGLVNDKNIPIINILINKGIFRYDEDRKILEMMNNSFRNFVLTQLSEKEEKNLKDKMKGHATWNTFKIPAIIMVTTIVLFLLATQQDTVEEIAAFVGASAATITVILRALSGLFNKTRTAGDDVAGGTP